MEGRERKSSHLQTPTAAAFHKKLPEGPLRLPEGTNGFLETEKITEELQQPHIRQIILKTTELVEIIEMIIKQGSFINLTCVAISLPGLPIDVDWFHKNKVG